MNITDNLLWTLFVHNIYVINKSKRKQRNYWTRTYVIEGEKILNNQSERWRTHKENQFKNRNDETSYRHPTENIREKPTEKNTIIAIFFKNKLKQIQNLKREVQEPRFEDEKEIEEISKRVCQLEDRLE